MTTGVLRLEITPATTLDYYVDGVFIGPNVAIADRMVNLTEVARSFEALQRGISVLMNDVDSRAIVELGRR